MAKLEFYALKLPKRVSARATGKGFFFRAFSAGSAHLNINGPYDPFLGSCETSNMRRGVGTTSIVCGPNGEKLKPYSIVESSYGSVAWFREEQIIEGTLGRLDHNVEVMSFRLHDIIQVRAIMRTDTGLKLLRKWVREHNKVRGVRFLHMPDSQYSREAWSALDALALDVEPIGEATFRGFSWSGPVMDALRKKAENPNEIAYADIGEYKKCECGLYIKEYDVCRCVSAKQNDQLDHCDECNKEV